jgi:predicted SAM-dependent methyltransferase
MHFLHLGCGNVQIPGFTHIDLADLPNVDLVHRVDVLPMYETSSVDMIYACHVLEHFGRHQISNVLREWFRVLKPSHGILRLSVPNFEAVVEHYLSSTAAIPINDVLGLVCGGQKNSLDYHNMIFDKKSLSGLLHDVGFSLVEEWDWKTVSHASIDDYSQAFLPHMDKVNGRLMSLNLQATK